MRIIKSAAMDYDRAIADWTAALKIKPDDANALNNRGYAYAIKGDIDWAITDWTSALRIKSDYAEAFYSRGLAYADKAVISILCGLYPLLTTPHPCSRQEA